jgi:hypothetical protein
MGEDMFNHFGADLDGRGFPHFAYARRDPGGIPQLWHLWWTGQGWKSSIASDYKTRFPWTQAQQYGKASTALSRPSLAVSPSGKAILISRSRERDNSLEFFVSQDSNYTMWKKTTIFDGSLGGWEPQWDLPLWREKGRLDFLAAGITDRAFQDQAPGWGRSLKHFIHLLRQPLKSRDPFSGYYSTDDSVRQLSIDPRLQENEGYLLEVEIPR